MMRRKSVEQLLSMLESDKWKSFSSSEKKIQRFNANEIRVGFQRNKKHLEYANQVKVHFGDEILKELKWELGDKIGIFFDPDDHFMFKLAKVQTVKSYTLSKQTKCSYSMVTFPWPHESIKIVIRPAEVVDFYIHKGQVLIFAVSDK
jgi:hypothetical protein